MFARSDAAYRASSSTRDVDARVRSSCAVNRSSSAAAFGSGTDSDATSCSASNTRDRIDCPHTSVTAPHAATIAVASTTPCARRPSANAAIAAIHTNGYNGGKAPGARIRSGARSAAVAAIAGAIQSGNPRRFPSAARPAAAPAISTETAARKIVASHASQSDAFTPAGGN